MYRLIIKVLSSRNSIKFSYITQYISCSLVLILELKFIIEIKSVITDIRV